MNLDARHNLGQRTAPSAVSVPPRQVSLLPPKYAWWPPNSGARNNAVEVYGMRASGKHKIKMDLYSQCYILSQLGVASR